MRAAALLAIMLLAGAVDTVRTGATAQAAPDAPLLVVIHDARPGFRPAIVVGPILNSRALEEAALGGLPVRIRFRVELWRDRLFDQLVDSVSWSSVVVYEPLGDQYFLRSQPGGSGARRFGTFAALRAAVESRYPLEIRPPGPGRFYYTGSVQIETLSMSDLDELERWLQGQLQPAVSGQRAVPAAIGQGARRLLLRLLDLPHRRADARSPRFTVP